VTQPLRIGAQGRYELLGEIESGGMGTVWRGYDSVLDREIAIKRIHPDVFLSPTIAEEFTHRFRREARVTARINHHGVPQVYDAVLDEASGDRLYLVMEYVRGMSLRKALAAAYPEGAEAVSTPFPVSWAASIAAQICTVLSYAHAVPVVHRDLKPDNVLIATDGTVKVLDFGIAKLLRTDVTRLTATGRVMGTTHYMAPEQIDNGQITPRTDLYALGCVLFELLTGRRVFDGDNDYRRQQKHMEETPTPVGVLRPDVPEDMTALILELLAKSPEQRPVDALAVYDRLVPHLPVPGSPADAGPVSSLAVAPVSVPDPTTVFRRPNAPLRRVPVPPPAPEAPPEPEPVPVLVDTALDDMIREAYARSADLADQERYAQAADVLTATIKAAAEVLGARNPRVLGLRQQRAAIFMYGEDYRRALPEFDALASAHADFQGPLSEDALRCRQRAAHCRANLGQSTAALEEFRALLEIASKDDSDASETALDLRRSIGILLLSEGRRTEALDVLDALHEDMGILLGEDHEETREIAAHLALLRGPEE
jgi:serine/threonine protein kinase